MGNSQFRLSLQTYALAFAAVLSPAWLQMSSCPSGNPNLEALEFKVDDTDQLNWAFGVYSYAVTMSSPTAQISATTVDLGSTISIFWYDPGTGQYSEPTELGTGEVNDAEIDIPKGSHGLYVNVVAPGGKQRATYISITNSLKDSLGMTMACRDNFTQMVWTFPIDLLNVTPDDCILEGQPFNVEVDPVMMIDEAPLNAFASWACYHGATVTEIDISVAQVSIDAIAGAACIEQLAELSPVPQTVALDVTITGDCGFGGSITVNSDVSIPLPHQVLSCTAGTAGSEVQICSTGQVPLSLSASDPPVQTFARLEVGESVALVYQCNTSSTTVPAPGETVTCTAPNPSGECAALSPGNVGETPFGTPDCDFSWYWEGNEGFPGRCTTVPVGVDPATVCATFPVQSSCDVGPFEVQP